MRGFSFFLYRLFLAADTGCVFIPLFFLTKKAGQKSQVPANAPPPGRPAHMQCMKGCRLLAPPKGQAADPAACFRQTPGALCSALALLKAAVVETKGRNKAL